MVFGEISNLPFYYRKLAGNIPDSKTVKNLLFDLDALGFSKVKRVMDRGFYSEDNINALFKDHLKFLISVKMSLAFIRKELDAIYKAFRTFNEDAVNKAKRYFGFFALLTNETMGAVTALELYRNKDIVEKSFGNLKKRLNVRRTLVSSEQSLEGKLFVEFVALIYLSYIKKRMQETDLFKTYTLQGALDKLDVIECFEAPGQKPRVGELLEKQKQICINLGFILLPRYE